MNSLYSIEWQSDRDALCIANGFVVAKDEDEAHEKAESGEIIDMVVRGEEFDPEKDANDCTAYLCSNDQLRSLITRLTIKREEIRDSLDEMDMTIMELEKCWEKGE